MLNKIITSSKDVVDNAKSVKINFSNIDILIKEINNSKYQHYLTKNPFGIMDLNTEDLINFLLIYDSIDFSFWGDPKWTIDADGELLDGGIALLYAMLKIFKTNTGRKAFEYMAEMTKDEFSLILKGNIDIPLLNERYDIITNISKKVLKDMNGSFYNYIINITNDTELFNLIVNNFSSFKDERTYNGINIPFYKLAQLLTSDILHILEFKENIKVDYSHLVGCADYKIPQIMRAYNILEYNEELTNIVDNKITVDENAEFEVEIRASMIVVVDFIYNKLGGRIKRIDINDYIWNKGREKSLILKPYHLTRTTSY